MILHLLAAAHPQLTGLLLILCFRMLGRLRPGLLRSDSMIDFRYRLH
jgi:hypothetical protein